MKKAIYTGSFDPVTLGHMDIIRRAADTFDELVVGVLNNKEKKPLFSVEERVKILQEAVRDYGLGIRNADGADKPDAFGRKIRYGIFCYQSGLFLYQFFRCQADCQLWRGYFPLCAGFRREACE